MLRSFLFARKPVGAALFLSLAPRGTSSFAATPFVFTEGRRGCAFAASSSTLGPQRQAKAVKQKSPAKADNKTAKVKGAKPELPASTAAKAKGPAKTKGGDKAKGLATKNMKEAKVLPIASADADRSSDSGALASGSNDGDDFETALRRRIEESVTASLRAPMRKVDANAALKEALRQRRVAQERQWRAERRGETAVSGASQKGKAKKATKKSKAAAHPSPSAPAPIYDRSTSPSARLLNNYYYLKARDFDARIAYVQRLNNAKLSELSEEGPSATTPATTSPTAEAGAGVSSPPPSSSPDSPPPSQ